MDQKPWEKDSCATLKAHYAVFSVAEAAALWCGVTEDKLDEIVKECQQLTPTGLGRSIWKHPDIPCIEPRSRAIAEAIESGELPHGREDAQTVRPGEHVAYERRHFFGRDLKKWMEKAFPTEKPAFLFDLQERLTGSGISLEDYQTLQAKHDALQARVDNAEIEYRKLRAEHKELIKERDNLMANVNGQKPLSPRAEATYQRIIAALLSYLQGEVPGVEKHPSFTNVSALIAKLASAFEGYDGLSTRNLSSKLPEAKRSLDMK